MTITQMADPHKLVPVETPPTIQKISEGKTVYTLCITEGQKKITDRTLNLQEGSWAAVMVRLAIEYEKKQGRWTDKEAEDYERENAPTIEKQRETSLFAPLEGGFIGAKILGGGQCEVQFAADTAATREAITACVQAKLDSLGDLGKGVGFEILEGYWVEKWMTTPRPLCEHAHS